MFFLKDILWECHMWCLSNCGWTSILVGNERFYFQRYDKFESFVIFKNSEINSKLKVVAEHEVAKNGKSTWAWVRKYLCMCPYACLAHSQSTLCCIRLLTYFTFLCFNLLTMPGALNRQCQTPREPIIFVIGVIRATSKTQANTV